MGKSLLTITMGKVKSAILGRSLYDEVANQDLEPANKIQHHGSTYGTFEF